MNARTVAPPVFPRGKRLLDLTLLAAASPVLAPAMAAVAVAALVQDGGPLLFHQDRVGLGGALFSVHKFRTMTTEPHPADRTITRFGRWARGHGVDELPQLLNVLSGEMSLVGPRPLSPADLRRLSVHTPALARRTEQPPGLTGLAQVTQARGPAENARMDALYAEHRSMALDVEILARTVWVNLVGKRRGAWSVAAAEARFAH